MAPEARRRAMWLCHPVPLACRWGANTYGPDVRGQQHPGPKGLGTASPEGPKPQRIGAKALPPAFWVGQRRRSRCYPDGRLCKTGGQDLLWVVLVYVATLSYVASDQREAASALSCVPTTFFVSSQDRPLLALSSHRLSSDVEGASHSLQRRASPTRVLPSTRRPDGEWPRSDPRGFGAL